ncbi:DUF742 domain-containing protein [Nocardia stercoris]|uniref:DUF742 domain-containing protein n=1 Tax=Nocardia stercoris TaxID=2483361 RepID=A0A3M2LEH0_9NOCA|nr:DUF742 domain-containing protein [Nocardia stercoris]RMI35170.1 DUF742 domain-containing protein [Nocardia stercoris]
MTPRGAHRDETPDRLYTLTGGRSRPDSGTFDLVTLVVAESDPVPGMQSEHIAILRLCRAPTAVAEIAAELGVPVGIAVILLEDLLATGKITARHPGPPVVGALGAPPLRPEVLERVLVGLRKL